MGCTAEVIALDEVCASHQRQARRQQLHERFDEWLNEVEARLLDPAPTLAQVSETIWTLRQTLTAAVAQTIIEQSHQEVAAGMRRSATVRGLSDKQRHAIDTCADYLLNRQYFLRYDAFLAQGFPIATGVIEGACRHLVKDRMDLTGARWRLKRAEAVLQLRALRSSNDFEAYWAFHTEQELQRHHVSRYADALFLDAA